MANSYYAIGWKINFLRKTNRTRVGSSVIRVDDITLSNTKAVNLSKRKRF
ncbi:hypothetical protein PMCN01_1673 [Pasteurella multocida subsp. multocida HB01]|nr:hypothetical protein Pmu_17160 [Pasteurella multocida 36950]AHE65086.1 hypothetical protein PMCN03_1653 [Pasteurella multocida subsp. multocida str. HB03]ANJ90893.1 hypothetical protein PMCN01_1673 [Pasteurella multocida subsp. multocida HB01]